MMQYPRDTWRKLLFKAPIYLYRLGLRHIVGRYLMLITHTGRKSGLPRRTMTEFHRTHTGRKYVPCAFREKSQWYQNIKADPRVTIQTAYGTEHVKARLVTETNEFLQAYQLIQRRNPVMFSEYLKSVNVKETASDIILNKDRIYIITFDKTADPTPPPLEADLAWVWPVLGGIAVIAALLRRK